MVAPTCASMSSPMVGTPASLTFAARVERALRVVTVGLLRAHRQVGHEHVGPRVPERLRDVHRPLVGLGDDLEVVLTQPVQGRPALHRDPGRGHVTDLDRVVLAGHDGLGNVAPDLLGVHVKRGDEFHVAYVIGPELDVHQARNPAVRVGILVVLHALDEGTGAVPDADDGYPYRTHSDSPYLLPRGVAVSCQL